MESLYFLEQEDSFLEQEASLCSSASFLEQATSFFSADTSFLLHVPALHFFSGAVPANAEVAMIVVARAANCLIFMLKLRLRLKDTVRAKLRYSQCVIAST